MFCSILNLVFALAFFTNVQASHEDPISLVSVYNYKPSPKNGYQIFFNDFNSNFHYSQCFGDFFNFRGQTPYGPGNFFNHDFFPFYDVPLRNIFYNPIFVAVRSLTVPDRFDIHFAPKGMYSIFNEPHFNNVKMFMLTPTEKAALTFHPKNFFNFKMFNMRINDFSFSEDYSVGDFVKTVNHINRIPVFAIFDKYDFESYHFDYAQESGKIAVYEHYIEPLHEPEMLKVRH